MQFGYSKEDCDLLIKYVHEGCYSHEDFRDLLQKMETSGLYESASIDLAS